MSAGTAILKGGIEADGVVSRGPAPTERLVFDFALELLVLLVIALLVMAPMVLGIVAFVRTGRIRQLSERVRRLEELLGPTTLPPLAVERPPAPAARVAKEPTLRPIRPSAPRPRTIDWESFLGRKALGWAAVLLIIFAGGFFLQYAFENQWIGPLGRVALAAAAGILLVAGGRRARRRGWRIYFQMLTSAGVVLFYLAVYGAFGFYHLLPRGPASVFLVLIIVESAALALLADAPALGLMAILGGLLTPLLLRSETDQYVSFFLYLFALDVGAVLMIALKRWAAVGSVALLGTHLLFWGWYFANFHPEKRSAALGFQAAVFLLFLGHPFAARAIRRSAASWEDLGRWMLNATLGFAVFYVLLEPDQKPWLGTFAVALAAVYAGLARGMLHQRPTDERLFLATLAIAVGLIAAAFPIQANASWVALGWAAEAGVLWWFGVRVASPPLRLLGVALIGLAVGRVFLWDLPFDDTNIYWPILNDHAIPALGVAACWLGAIAATRRRMASGPSTERTLAAVAEVGGVLMVWWVLSIDLNGAFDARAMRGGPDAPDWERIGRMSLSVLWAAYAAIVLAVGFAARRPPLRWTALALFGLVVAKVFLVDMRDLGEIYRIVAFLAAAVVLGVAAGVYQRLRPSPAEMK